MSGFYAYAGTCDLGKEPCGSDGRAIRRDLKTADGFLRYCRRVFKGPFRAYHFGNFFDDRTFHELKQRR